MPCHDNRTVQNRKLHQHIAGNKVQYDLHDNQNINKSDIGLKSCILITSKHTNTAHF